MVCLRTLPLGHLAGGFFVVVVIVGCCTAGLSVGFPGPLNVMLEGSAEGEDDVVEDDEVRHSSPVHAGGVDSVANPPYSLAS